MVSYEVSIGFVLITVILLAGSMNLTTIVQQQAGWFWRWNAFAFPTIFVMLPMAVIFFVSGLAETNRPPFDLPEAESELVAGYMVEYSSTPFLLFQIGEYANIVLICAMMAILFFGGWLPPFPTPFIAAWPPFVANLFFLLIFIMKVLCFFIAFAIVKAIVPRYRYDQLMRLGWKVFLPTTLVAVALIAAWRVFFTAGGM
jgi:NADH-quinone oxidoreductase subunit H